ncbi:hypothetical protein K9B35_00775 [Sphingomonas sp. R647]|uniref:hypothetical protein n=1 Tax=Sphingomonas sp. R647 TaxID=2875233 RepID=UPI001CD65F09|nr:hypothetical protein [Sphingomonas sp. R647]MCA1196490.1 hypothetical protein [Sphingomonas sp. R647]
MAVFAAHAQDVSENRNWQFATPQDLAARTAALDLIMKQRAGVYAAPVYNTTIDRQYNCSVGATATGNHGAQSALANSPSVTGTSANATGNLATSSGSGDSAGADVDVDVDQRNGGAVGALASGDTGAVVNGPAWQALNSDQRNSGNQNASVSGSTACGFGALN